LIAVGWVDNQAGPAAEEVSRPLPGLLATNLSRVRGLAIVSDARLNEMLSQLGSEPNSAQAITQAARRAGADQLLQGVLYRRVQGLQLDLRRIELGSGVVREAYTADGGDAFDLADHVTATVARAFSLDAPDSPLRQSGTSSLTARRLYEQGLRAFYRGDMPGAHELFAAAVQEDSTFAAAAHYAATTRVYDDIARRYYEQALRLAERAPDRERLWIKFTAQGSDDGVQRAVADTLVARFPKDPDSHLAMGVVRQTAGDFLAAIPHARRVLAMDSVSLHGNPGFCRACDAYAMVIGAYYAVDSVVAAERTAREWTRRQSSSSGAWSTFSNVLMFAGKYDEAVTALQKAESLQPTPLGAYRRAHIAIHSGNFADADRILRERLSADAADDYARWTLSISLRYQGRIQEALRLAEGGHVRTRHDLHPIAVAQSLFELHRYREAAATFDSLAHHAGPTGPTNTRGATARHLSWYHTHVAASLAAAGDTSRLPALADSIGEIARLSSYGRDWHLADHVRGLYWMARGQPERAAAFFRAAIYSPVVGYSRTNFELARALLALNRPKEAIPVLRAGLRGPVEASSSYVTQTELHDLLAKTFERANQPDSAAAHYRRVITAWSAGDPPFRARADSARARIAALSR
jgi:tetratricopeptide (TPR) repeat protein